MLEHITKSSKLSPILRTLCLLVACGIFVALPAAAQDTSLGFPVTIDKKLAARATNVNEVTMNKNMLNFASQFLGSKKNDQQAKNLIQKLNGIYVREYEFDKPGEYSAEDLAALRRQVSGPGWNPMVRERSKKGKGDSDVYLKLVNGEVQGLFVLDAKPTNLSLVYISGPIRPQDLKDLSGNFGVPNINGAKGSSESSGETAR